MRKLLLILFCILILSPVAQAQQKNYDWRIGISGGYTNYYGDLSPHTIQGLSNWDAIHHLFYFNENYFEDLSFKISLERQLSPSVGLMFSYGQYSFGMSDQYIQRHGTLMINAPNFDRALNFHNRTRDMGIAFVFKMDNDVILPANSFIAPYLNLGGGFLDFEVRGDLRNDLGNTYNYAAGNVVRNNIYETNLTPLRTEREDGYSTGVFYANLGLGLRFRLGPTLELFVQSDFIHAFTDYLDDVSGNYRTTYDNAFQAYAARPGTNVIDATNPQRGNPNNPNDWIIYHGVGLKFNFGYNKRAFRAPRLSTHYPDYRETATRTTPRATAPIEEKVKVEEISTDPRSEATTHIGNSYTYFNNIQLVPTPGIDTLAYNTQMLNWEQEIQQKQNRILEGQLQQRRLEDLQRPIDQRYTGIREDTLMTRTRRDTLLDEVLRDRADIRYSLDSIQRREKEIQTEIDSLQRLKETARVQPTTMTYNLIGLDRILGIQDEERGPFTTTDTLPTALRSQALPADAAAPPAQIPQALEPEQEAALSPMQQRSGRAQERQRTEEAQLLDQRIRNLELENQRLQAQQEALRQRPGETIYRSPGVTGTQPSRAVVPRDRQVITTYPTPGDDPTRRVRDRTPRSNPFAGLFRSRRVTPPEQAITAQDTVTVEEMDEEMMQRVGQLGQNINMALFGVSLPPVTVDEEVLEETPEEEVTSEEVVEVEDSILLEDTEVTLLKSKTEIFFDVNQTRPALEEMKKLAPLVDFIKDNEEYILTLRGFADNTGNVAYNLKLIESRIEEVINVLTDFYGLTRAQLDKEVGGQIVRGPGRSPNENDRKVEVRIERR